MEKNMEKRNSNPKKTKKKGIFNRVFSKIAFYLILVAIIGSGAFVLGKKLSKVNVQKNQEIVEKQLKTCQELAVLKYEYSEIVSIKKTRIAGLAKSFSIIRYSGILRAGISNIEEAEISVTPSKKVVSVKLPEAEILGNDITDLEVFDESQSIFIPIPTQDIFDLINESRQEKELSLVEKGILVEAKNKAELFMESLLYNLGFQKVIVE